MDLTAQSIQKAAFNYKVLCLPHLSILQETILRDEPNIFKMLKSLKLKVYKSELKIRKCS